MPMWECRIEVPRTALEAIEAAVAILAEPRWSTWDDRQSDRAWLTGFFGIRSAAMVAWECLAGTVDAGFAKGGPTLRRLADAEWRDRYKLHFKPGHIGRLHWAPVWEQETYYVPPGDVVVWLDPGMALGTGNHETTLLALERLVAFAGAHPATPGSAEVRRVVVDAGCGSGILSIAAVRLGLGPVTGFDNDPAAVAVSAMNAALNGLTTLTEFQTADLSSGLSRRQADLLLANIQSDVLARHANLLVAAVVPGGWLALGGILDAELTQFREEFVAAAPGWMTDSRRLGEWADLLLVRPR